MMTLTRGVFGFFGIIYQSNIFYKLYVEARWKKRAYAFFINQII